MSNSSLKIEIDSLLKSFQNVVANFFEFLKVKSKNKPTLKFREFGFAKGKIQLSNDFDEPLDLFKDYN